MSWALDTLQVVLVVLVAILITNYLFMKWIMHHKRVSSVDTVEAFANPGKDDGTNTVVLGNELLFDDFYAKIYDQVVDGSQRQDAEVNLTIAWVKNHQPEVSHILALDIGCGTGGQVAIFKKAGVGKAVGIDRSESMIARGRALHPDADLRVGDVEVIGTAAAGEYSLATMYYFTYYYLQDRTVALQNIFNWLKPGGCFVIHLVNREKFDPILESASPFLAFSVQKYSKERDTQQSVF
jgi:SAM-dependent methyltransferase